jgi:hypothetical protein
MSTRNTIARVLLRKMGAPMQSKIVDAIEAMMALAGFSPMVASVIANAIPRLIGIIQAAIIDERDVQAELDAALDGIEAGIIAAGEKKFGDDK